VSNTTKIRGQQVDYSDIGYPLAVELEDERSSRRTIICSRTETISVDRDLSPDPSSAMRIANAEHDGQAKVVFAADDEWLDLTAALAALRRQLGADAVYPAIAGRWPLRCRSLSPRI